MSNSPYKKMFIFIFIITLIIPLIKKIAPFFFKKKLITFASGGQGALFEKTAPWTPTKAFVQSILP
jgi:hypothetical protein